jgi:putative NADH-flavin reductase
MKLALFGADGMAGRQIAMEALMRGFCTVRPEKVN